MKPWFFVEIGIKTEEGVYGVSGIFCNFAA